MTYTLPSHARASRPDTSELAHEQPARAGWRLREAAERGARIGPGELAHGTVWAKAQESLWKLHTHAVRRVWLVTAWGHANGVGTHRGCR
jgi:hypothetical protein